VVPLGPTQHTRRTVGRCRSGGLTKRRTMCRRTEQRNHLRRNWTINEYDGISSNPSILSLPLNSTSSPDHRLALGRMMYRRIRCQGETSDVLVIVTSGDWWISMSLRRIAPQNTYTSCGLSVGCLRPVAFLSPVFVLVQPSPLWGSDHQHQRKHENRTTISSVAGHHPLLGKFHEIPIKKRLITEPSSMAGLLRAVFGGDLDDPALATLHP
jgi:hypothetical protein